MRGQSIASENAVSVQQSIPFEAKELDKYIRDVEHRLTEHVNIKMEKQSRKTREFESHVELTHEKFSRDMAMDIKTLEGRMAEHLKEIKETTITVLLTSETSSNFFIRLLLLILSARVKELLPKTLTLFVMIFIEKLR